MKKNKAKSKRKPKISQKKEREVALLALSKMSEAIKLLEKYDKGEWDGL